MPCSLRITICAFFLSGVVSACGNGGDQSDSQSSMPPGDPPPTVPVPAVAGKPDATDPMYAQEGTKTGETAGVGWTVPARWEAQPPRTMRVATYLIPKAEGDDEPAECAVFFFGRGQGGGVELNLQRWRDQFEMESGSQNGQSGPPEPPTPAQRKSTINGLTVTTVSLAGTYLASMGPMFQSGAVKKPGYKMLGAIIEAPEGNVFLKLTGPEQTVLAAEGEFQDFLKSLRK